MIVSGVTGTSSRLQNPVLVFNLNVNFETGFRTGIGAGKPASAALY